jgi:predicted P-loop ATPase/GTPase
MSNSDVVELLNEARRLIEKLLDEVARRRGCVTIERLNDYSTHEQVLGAFDEAIVAASMEACR